MAIVMPQHTKYFFESTLINLISFLDSQIELLAYGFFNQHAIIIPYQPSCHNKMGQTTYTANNII